jgi:hypothetical protein
MSRSLVLAVMAVAAGLSAIPASAAPPRAATITSVGTTYRHATATWTLPAGVEPQLIELASAPSVGSDGSFFEENREESDLLRQGQTSYVGADELGLGTHWLHVQTVDNNCSSIENSTCIAWSNIVRLTIGLDANSRPALRLVHFDVHLHEAQVTACDETDGRLTFRTTLSVNRFGYGHVTRRRTYSPFTRPTYTEGERNCSPYFVPLPPLYGVGRYTLTMTVTDARGGRSKPVVKRFSVRD